MVNYLYDLEHIERNHEAYAQQRTIVAANAITRLIRAPAPVARNANSMTFIPSRKPARRRRG